MFLKHKKFLPLVAAFLFFPFAAYAQVDLSTGFAGELKGATALSQEGPTPSHSIACFEGVEAARTECILWLPKGGPAVTQADAETDGASVVGVGALGPRQLNTAVVFLMASDTVLSPTAMAQAVAEFGPAARVSVRSLNGDGVPFERIEPDLIDQVRNLVFPDNAVGLSAALDQAIDDLALYQARPKALVLIADGDLGLSNSDVTEFSQRAEALGIRTIHVFQGETSSIAGNVDFQLRLGQNPSLAGFPDWTASAFRVSVDETATNGDPLTVAVRFAEAGRAAFIIEDGAQRVLVFNAASDVFGFSFTSLLPEMFSHIPWLVLLGLASLVLVVSPLLVKREKTAVEAVSPTDTAKESKSARVNPQYKAETQLDNDRSDPNSEETEIEETDILEDELAALELLTGTSGQRVSLTTATTKIGRLPYPVNDVVLGDQNVSREHAVLHLNGDGSATIENLTAKADGDKRINPIAVNGERIDGPFKLNDGDEVRLGSSGDTRVRFHAGSR